MYDRLSQNLASIYYSDVAEYGRQIYKNVSFLLLSALLLFCSQQVVAKNSEFFAYNRDSFRPKAPTIISINGEPVGPKRTYQKILDELSSENYETREMASKRLYEEREMHIYSIDLLMPMLQDDSELVRQYVTSVIVDTVNRNPSISPILEGFFEEILTTFISSEDPFTRANCIALLSWATDSFDKVEELIVTSLNDKNLRVIRNAAVAVTYFAPNSIEIYRVLSKQVDAGVPYQIAEAMASIALRFVESSESYNADRLMDGVALLKESKYLSWVEERIDIIESVASTIRARAAGIENAQTEEIGSIFQVSEDFDWSLFDGSVIKLNGKNVSIKLDKASNSIKFLGDNTGPIEGLNVFDSIRVNYSVWMEDNFLRKFENPYKSSYAFIVAIDRYKGTGYQNLGNMVSRADVLGEQLVQKGFLKENIFTLYNEEATSSAISNLLKEFWQGGKYSDADRLVFYYGGHGDYIERQSSVNGGGIQTGFLVTSDHNKSRPTVSSLLMKDLTGSHFENIVSNHVLMLVDSCSSGLALPRFQSSDKDLENLSKFKKYIVIESEVKRPARNIIVAGTGAQKALWENGGIFTTALIKGISGKADYNHDGVTEFDELSLYIKNNVRAKAASTGVEQEPHSFKASSFGGGSVIFLGL